MILNMFFSTFGSFRGPAGAGMLAQIGLWRGMVCLEELEPDCKSLKVFERFPKIWKVPGVFGKL